MKTLIKHSLPTAFRQVVSRLETQRHRIGGKSLIPAGRLRCGLLGSGHFFQYAYVPALNLDASPIAVTGILTRDAAKFAAAQKPLRYAAAPFHDLDALLASDLDAVLILLPNDLHFSTAQKALEHGLHVYCEKPLANSVVDAQALKTTAQRSGRVLMTGFNERFFDRNRVLARLIAEQAVGGITEVHAFHNQDLRGLKSFAPLHRDHTGGGALHNAGIHFINLFLYWFGVPETVQAVFENRALPAECGEDTAHCELWFPGGVKATLDVSLANAVETTYERVKLTGPRGFITSDFKKCDIFVHPSGKPQLKIPCRPEIISDSVAGALAHFARCAGNNLRPETDVEDFVRTMKTVEALTLSASRGAVVHWKEIENTHVR